MYQMVQEQPHRVKQTSLSYWTSAVATRMPKETALPQWRAAVRPSHQAHSSLLQSPPQTKTPTGLPAECCWRSGRRWVQQEEAHRCRSGLEGVRQPNDPRLLKTTMNTTASKSFLAPFLIPIVFLINQHRRTKHSSLETQSLSMAFYYDFFLFLHSEPFMIFDLILTDTHETGLHITAKTDTNNTKWQ